MAISLRNVLEMTWALYVCFFVQPWLTEARAVLLYKYPAIGDVFAKYPGGLDDNCWTAA